MQNEISKCITNNPNIGIIPLNIGTPTSDIGIDAKSAIIIDITNSKGCNCQSPFFPISLITNNTSKYNTIVLIKLTSIKLTSIFKYYQIYFSQKKLILCIKKKILLTIKMKQNISVLSFILA